MPVEAVIRRQRKPKAAEQHVCQACEHLGLPAERVAELESLYSQADLQTLRDMLVRRGQSWGDHEGTAEIIAEVGATKHGDASQMESSPA